MGYTIVYLSLIVLIPLSTLFFKSAGLGWSAFWTAATSPRVMAAYRLSFGASLVGALINVAFGTLVAWTLVRYAFPGNRSWTRWSTSRLRCPPRSPASH